MWELRLMVRKAKVIIPRVLPSTKLKRESLNSSVLMQVASVLMMQPHVFSRSEAVVVVRLTVRLLHLGWYTFRNKLRKWKLYSVLEWAAKRVQNIWPRSHRTFSHPVGLETSGSWGGKNALQFLKSLGSWLTEPSRGERAATFFFFIISQPQHISPARERQRNYWFILLPGIPEELGHLQFESVHLRLFLTICIFFLNALYPRKKDKQTNISAQAQQKPMSR